MPISLRPPILPGAYRSVNEEPPKLKKITIERRPESGSHHLRGAESRDGRSFRTGRSLRAGGDAAEATDVQV
jgi:hypothetical protein